MTKVVATATAPALPISSALRLAMIGTVGFLTLVDLFAAQAILPTLANTYAVSPAAMGFAVNASTIGMAVSSLVLALVGARIDARTGIWLSLAVLAVPTGLLAVAPDLVAFTALRVVQGLLMAAAFTLTMAYLAEHSSPEQTATSLAAYVTGGVASNLFGRFISAAVADHAGLATNFEVFAILNLAGAALVMISFRGMARKTPQGAASSTLARWMASLRNPVLWPCLGIGFLILFVFIGTFTYVNFVLAAEPISLSQMRIGFVYLVFAPSLVSTPFAGHAVRRLGLHFVFRASLLLTAVGLPLLVVPRIEAVLAGMVIVAVGTFFAQATATGFVGRAAGADRATASGLYLASYYLGGLAGAAVLGQVFDRFGWSACVAGIGLALGCALLLSERLHTAARRGR